MPFLHTPPHKLPCHTLTDGPCPVCPLWSLALPQGFSIPGVGRALVATAPSLRHIPSATVTQAVCSWWLCWLPKGCPSLGNPPMLCTRLLHYRLCLQTKRASPSCHDLSKLMGKWPHNENPQNSGIHFVWSNGLVCIQLV